MKILSNLSQESIYQQFDTAFGKELEVEFEKLRQYSVLSNQLLSRSNITSIVKKYIGITIEVELTDEISPFVIIPVIEKNHVIINDSIKPYLMDIPLPKEIRNKKVLTGKVDIKNVKVSGDIALLPSHIYLSTYTLNKYSDYTIAENVAMFLHEIGHIFVYYELLVRMSRTNYLVNDICEQMMRVKTPEKRVELWLIVEELTEVKIPNKTQLASKQRNIATTSVIILQQELKSIQNDLDIKFYSERGYEQLADNFAARMGYAVPLSTSLNKMDKVLDNRNSLSPSFNILINIIIAAATMLEIYRKPLTIIFLIFNIMIQGNPLTSRYDDRKSRIIKIKNQINDRIKDSKLPLVQKQMLIEEHKVILAVLDTVYSYSDNYTLFWSYIMPSGIKAKNIIQDQDELESLSNSDLFVVATSLSLL